MTMYCYVENDVVVTGPRGLPSTWKNISNFDNLSDSELLLLGWYPYVEHDPGSPGSFYNPVYSDFVIGATEVTRTVTYEQWAIDDIRQFKDDEMSTQLREYTTNEHVINPKIAEYIKDDAKWFSDEQGNLVRLTDWDAVANYNTAKPEKMVLPYNYVGQSYVNQGVALSAANQDALDNGLPEPWDQIAVDELIAANRPAAEDSSGATSPVHPDFKTRQGVAVVSEQFNRIVIYRFDTGSTDPNLDRSLGMRMRNRQDSRDLYCFPFEGAASLGWKQFKDLGNGVWGWEWSVEEDDAANMHRTDNDLHFILSYIANPTYQPGYFTKEIPFDSGVEQENILVSWDTE